jgi:DNA-damage-inducible protein J
MMTKQDSVVRARIDGKTKTEAEAVLASIGLTVSDAFRMMMARIAIEKALPFEPLIPNEETIAAIKAARRGELVTVGKAENLIAKLNAGD